MSRNPADLYASRVAEGSLKPDPVQKEAVAALQEIYERCVSGRAAQADGWIQKWLMRKKKDDSPPQGAYLYGGVGRGKSMLMDLFFDCLPSDIKARRVHFHEFMIEVHNYLHERRQFDGFSDGLDGALPSLISRLSEQARILCFDEFHVTDVADAMILGRLFTGLFDRGVVVIATSNWAPDDLYKGGLQRDRFLPFIALLKRRLRILHLDSPIDYRAQLLQEEGSYFTPLGDVSRRRADEVFALLTRGEEPRFETLTVKGREIPVRETAAGVARFTFAQLCEQPHGAEDYLAIARRYHTVFLENIPKMAYDRRNEAKRLMTLIDALYEGEVRLFVTAETVPERLYYGHDHAFEFERTVSRLREMQNLALKPARQDPNGMKYA